MDEYRPVAQPDVKFKLILRPSEPQEAGSDDDLVRFVRTAMAGLPKLSKGKFRLAEFPSNVVDQVLADAEKIERETEAVEAAMQSTPPSSDEREKRIRAAEAAMIAAVQAIRDAAVRFNCCEVNDERSETVS